MTACTTEASTAASEVFPTPSPAKERSKTEDVPRLCISRQSDHGGSSISSQAVSTSALACACRRFLKPDKSHSPKDYKCALDDAASQGERLQYKLTALFPLHSRTPSTSTALKALPPCRDAIAAIDKELPKMMPILMSCIYAAFCRNAACHSFNESLPPAL